MIGVIGAIVDVFRKVNVTIGILEAVIWIVLLVIGIIF